jgi:peptidoglycan/LPS O-acetylase OafA/YrhL
MPRTEADMKKYVPLILLDCAAFAVIIYTAWLGNHDNWITSNLSVIGYWRGYRGWLIGWGWLCAAVFVSYLIYLAKLYRIRGGVTWVFIALAGILLVTGVYLPYQPGQHPVLSNVHIGVSFLAPVCVVGALFCLLHRLMKQRSPFRWAMLVCMGCLLIAAAVIFVRCTIITTLLEVYTVSALTLFMTALGVIRLLEGENQVYKGENIYKK